MCPAATIRQPPTTIIYHRKRVKSNMAPGNTLMSGTQPTHQKQHALLLINIILLLFCCDDVHLASAASDVDNGVLGSPMVECGRDHVHFKVATKRAFGGRVYVKGEFDNPKCVNSMVPPAEKRNNNNMGGTRGGKVDEHGIDKDDQSGQTNGGRPEFNPELRNQQKESKEKEPSGQARKVDEDYNDGKATTRKNPWNGGGGVPEGEEEERSEGNANIGTEAGKQPQQAEGEEEVDEETIRQILQELQKRRNNNLDGSQRPIPSHLPGFGSAEQLKRWRSFLKGKPGLDGQGFRRYGSRLSPDANGECPLVCPPCDECDKEAKQHMEMLSGNRKGRQRRLASEHSAELRVPLGECNTRRDRMANPPGMQVSFTVVVSFHPSFITRVDRAYNIQCAYQEPERLLSTQIDVSPPPTIHISNQMETPQCEYRIHEQSSNDQVRNVRVGDMVEHEWACGGDGAPSHQRDRPADGHQVDEEGRDEQRMAEQFGLLIHDCFVDDGKSRKERVLDSRGCSTDPQILPTPEYSSNSLRASILSPVAKFPDGDLVGFQCSITVCMRDMGKCDGVTPPDCSSSSPTGHNTPLDPLDLHKWEKEDMFEAYSTDSNRTKRSIESDGKQPIDRLAMDWQLNSPLMTVFDMGEEADEEGSGQLLEQAAGGASSPFTALRHNSGGPSRRLHSSFPQQRRQWCVSLPLFTLLVSGGTFLATVSAGILFTLLLLRDSLLPITTKKH